MAIFVYDVCLVLAESTRSRQVHPINSMYSL
jgi:hypothetical protein